jgi:hypothetical protein
MRLNLFNKLQLNDTQNAGRSQRLIALVKMDVWVVG